jgi:pimeloyl-ACP methyl ester carboxylesterase
VIAPDLLGHGGSAKPRGNYSLGAYLSGLRDLLAALVSSGGLGREVGLVLRAATLPGAELVLPLITREKPRQVLGAASQLLGRLGLRTPADVRGTALGLASLSEPRARRAFLHTARSILDSSGTGERDRSPLSCRGHADPDRLGRA